MKKRLLALGVVCVAIAPLAPLAQETEEERTDRGLIVGFIEDNLSGAGRNVVLRGFQGALSSRATATQLTIADDEGVWLTLNDVVLDWNRSALLGGRVEVNELTAGEIIVARAPISAETDELPSPEAGGFSLPELPVSVKIGKISAPRVVLGESLIGQPVEGSVEASVILSGGEGSGKVLINRQDAGPDGRIELEASYSNTSTVLQLELTAEEDRDGIAANLLNLPGKPSVDLRLKGNGPLDDFAADVALKTDGTERLAGALVLTGTEQGGSRFTADIHGDMAPLFLPEYADFLGDNLKLQVSGLKAADGSLDLERMAVAARSLDLQGNLRLAADGLPELIALEGFLRDPEGKPVILPGTGGDVTLRAGRLSVGFDAGKGDGWSAVLEGEGANTPAFEATRLDLRGTGRIARQASGRLVDGSFTARSHGIRLKDPAISQAVGEDLQADADFLWQEDSGRLRLPKMALVAGPISVEGEADVFGFDQNLRLETKANVYAKDLAPLSALAGQPLSGKANLALTAKGSPLAGDFDVQAQISGQDMAIGMAEVDGLLRGMASASLDVVRDATGTTLRALQLRAEGLEVDGKGKIDSRDADLDLQLSMADLGRLGASYGGGVSGQLQLKGPLTEGRAHIVADLATKDLKVGIPEADQLFAGQARLDFEGDLDGQTLQLQRMKLLADGADVDLTGRLNLQDSDLQAKLALKDLSRLGAGYRGALTAEAQVSGSMENARLAMTAQGVGLRVGQEQADKLLAGTTKLEGVVRLENGALRIDNFLLNNPQLNATATGQIDGDARAVRLEARLANLGLILPEFPGAVTVSGTAVDRGRGYELALQGTGPGQIDARVNGTVASDFSSANLAVNGRAQAGLANPFLGNRVVTGPVSLDLRVNGPLALSSVSGQVRLSQGKLVDPTLPFALEAIDMAANLGNNRAQITGSTRLSTGGQVAISGPISLAAPFDGDLRIVLSNAVVRDPQLYQTRANADLRVNGGLAGGATISGRVDLVETEIRVASTGVSGQALLDGLRHVGDRPAVRETRRRAGLDGAAGASGGTGGGGGDYALNVEVSSPNQLFIRGRGLDAELGGTLHIGGTTSNVIPSGGFQLIRGRLEILGRRLDLSQASLQLEGDFDAQLNIVATSLNDGIASSVEITGSASDPQVTFSSQPELPQEEVLAQLLFGRRLDNLSALQALQLANAVATLAGRGGEGVVSKLRKGFGLDDLDVATESDGSAQLKAGKYLSENVYSEVAVDQQGRSQISLNLDISDNVTVKGNVGADGDTGLGIFYQRDY